MSFMEEDRVVLVECPRDAMQSFPAFIPTETKVEYINQLLQVGFDYIDFGSFVSPKVIPQLADTPQVIKKLNLSSTTSKLLAIVGNLRGAAEAASFDEVHSLGFPYSISPTFLKLNINSTPEAVMKTIEEVQNLCIQKNKELVVYLSMAFGNAYGEDCCLEANFKATDTLRTMGIRTISLADTLGLGNEAGIRDVFSRIIPRFPELSFGFHLHTQPGYYYKKVDAAFSQGCRRFDSVILGLGGCPMTSKDIVGNLSTEDLIGYFDKKTVNLKVNREKLAEAVVMARKIFTVSEPVDMLNT